MENPIKDYLYIVFLISLFSLWLIVDLSILWSLLIATGIYSALGGWYFLKIVLYTFKRDFKAGINLLCMRYLIYSMNKNHELIPDRFVRVAAEFGSKPAFIYEKEVWTYTDVDVYSNRVANYLLAAGFKAGDTIALFMESRPAYVGIWLGMAKIGIVPALINFNLRLNSLLNCIRTANARCLIYGPELVAAIDEIRAELQESCSVVLCVEGRHQGSGFSAAGCIDEQLAQSTEHRPPPVRSLKRSLRDPLIYIYTSGTTGMPKAAIVSHNRYLLMSTMARWFLFITPQDIIYTPLPLYHTAGGIVGVGQTLLHGTTVVIRRKFSASQFWDDCVQYNCTVVQYIGEICRYLLAQPVRPAERQHRIRLALGNGVRPQIWELFQQRFNVAQIGEFYGATESNANFINPDNKVGAIGFTTRILPWVHPTTLIRTDSVTGDPLRDSRGLCVHCRPGQPGQMVGKIVDKDPVLGFDGYLSKEATDKKVVRDVFRKGDKGFLSGDILEMDEYGYFYFRDRVGDTFRWRGENVATAEVEEVVSGASGLSDCVVFGVLVPGTEGRAGMAAIVDPDSRVDMVKLGVELTRKLPAYARPLFIRLCPMIESTGTYKLKKLELARTGFDPTVTSDPIFYWDARATRYVRLDAAAFDAIKQGEIQL